MPNNLVRSETVPVASLVSERKCWICGRTRAGVESAMAGDTSEEADLKEKIRENRKFKDEFLKRTGRWIKEAEGSPFTEQDYYFILRHPDQFNSLSFLNDVYDNHQSVFDELLQCQPGGSICTRYLYDEEASARAQGLLKSFGKKWEMPNSWVYNMMSSRERIYVLQLTGSLKLAEGLKCLQDAGVTVSNVEKTRMEGALRKSRPNWELRQLTVGGHPRKIDVCAVCSSVIQHFSFPY